MDVPPHFVPFGMIEDPYADELAQRSAEFARHAAFDDPTPPQGLPVWNPSPPLVPAAAPPSAAPEPAAPETEATAEYDPPLAAQLSLGQRFELAFAEHDHERDLGVDGSGETAGAFPEDDDLDLPMPDLEVDPFDSTLEITRDLTAAYGSRFEPLAPAEQPVSPPAPMSAPPSCWRWASWGRPRAPSSPTRRRSSRGTSGSR
jgi:hypothetical protein